MRLLTGIQSSGKPHLGNILGAILPAIELSRQAGNDSLYFIADMHSLTTVKDGDERVANVRSVAAAWLAFGFDVERNILFRQSDVPMVTELTWYLSCFAPYPMLANAHSFKDKRDRLSDVNAGLFTYPVLMAADILLYDVQRVPVGKDQIQHVEIASDIARAFNHTYQQEVFVVPQHQVDDTVMTVPGTDGQKMSKSYANTIDILQDEKAVRKAVMSIVTDSTPLEEPKDPEKDTTYHLYQLIASNTDAATMAARYRMGNFGYGHAKQELYQAILDKFATPRAEYNRYMADPAELDRMLKRGAERAAQIGAKTLERVRKITGFGRL